jgi:hypothetical protein
MTVYADPLDRRDGWRTLWQVLAGDALMLTLCLIVGMGLLASLLLPQSPAAGTADPVLFSQWEAVARGREGALFGFLNGLELNNVLRAGWWRLALTLLTAVCALRLSDRIARLVAARRQVSMLRDETRRRVAQDAPALPALAAHFGAMGYRTAQPSDDVLLADRAPWAEVFSIAMHAGVLLACIGLLVNAAFGWEAQNRALQSGAATALLDGYTLVLNESADEAGSQLILQRGETTVATLPLQSGDANGIHLALRQITPGYRISATATDAQPLLIRASNFISPTTEVLLNLTDANPEQYVALPDARLALAVTAGASPNEPARVRVFVLPSGQVVTETAVQPQLVVGEVTFAFQPARGAVIDASFAPGNGLVYAGLLMALIGFAGVLLRPMQRILVQHHGHWTEFYADGRGARNVINTLLAAPELQPQMDADERR